MNPIRHYLRIDRITQSAMDEICRHTFSTKSALMRRYVQEGVKRDAVQYAKQVEIVQRSYAHNGAGLSQRSIDDEMDGLLSLPAKYFLK